MSDQTSSLINDIKLKVGGAPFPIPNDDLEQGIMDSLLDIEVDQSLYLPDMFIMRFNDEKLDAVNRGPFETGKTMEISIGKDEEGATPEIVFKGEITAVEPEFTENMTAYLTVRGYDKRHRLMRGTKTKVYVNMMHSDIVQQLASAAGLSPTVESTGTVYEHIYQHNQTDLEFMYELARLNNFELVFDGDKLYFRKPKGSRGNVTLEWGSSLRSFRPRMTLYGQVSEVIVRGWDPKQKKELIGTASSSQTNPQIDVGGSGIDVTQKAFGAAKRMEVQTNVSTQSEAENLAQAILDDINSGFVEADGIAFGDPKLVAGSKVKIEKLGQRFSGEYVATTATHYFSQEGYDTHFRVEGSRPMLMSDLVSKSDTESGTRQRWPGVVTAIVTNINDPEGMGRVKLKYTWMDDQLETHWARVVTVGAGDQRGIYWLPEVNDEVVVAFEHGDFNRPYVMGSVWNGKDKAPEAIGDVVAGGKVVRRTMKTRTGHIIRLSDKPGDEFIEIIDSKTNNQIRLDTTKNSLTIDTKGNMTIKASGNIDVNATGNLTLKGAMVNIN